MDDRSESLLYLSAGPLAAILLGMALVPLRGLMPASNLAFAFMALTIVVAELRGRGAAIATAVASALSLDFFLTQPAVAIHVVGSAWDELRSALWCALAVASLVPWIYVGCHRSLPTPLLSELTATAAALFLLVVAAETVAGLGRVREAE